MTQQWQLSGNAENVDWSDLAMAGRAYADNLVGEPTISKVMHMMADEIERLRAAIRPESYEKSDEKRVLYDTKSPRNGALSGCETVPDPDSRVWETPCTPQTHATPPQGSVQGEGSFRVSQNANEPVAWAVTMGDGSVYEAFARHQYDEAVDLAKRCLFGTQGPLPLSPLYFRPECQVFSQKNLTLADDEREAINGMACYFDTRCELQMQAWGSLLRVLLRRLGGER